MSELGGKAVIREAIGASVDAHARQVAAAHGEQMELLPPDRPISVDGRIVPPEELQNRINERAKAGRPKNAQNLATREWREWWLSKGIDPVTSAIHDLALPLDVFAGHLGCNKLEAWDRRQKLREFVAPFLFARQATVDEKGNAVPTVMNMNFGQYQPRGADGKALLPWQYLDADAVRIEHNQALSETPDPEPQNEEPQK